MITVELPPYNMNLSFTNCVLSNNDVWSFLVVIFRKEMDFDLCLLPSGDTALHQNISMHSDIIHLEGCKFVKNKRPILKVTNEELSNNIPKLLLSGPIEFSQTDIGLRYSYSHENIAYIDNMVVNIKGPVIKLHFSLELAILHLVIR